MQPASVTLYPASALSLTLFGVPEVRYHGRALKFRSRKELALLVYLVVEGGPHSREQVMALLWPESDRQRSQASLRNTLVRLRQALGDASTYLHITPSVVSFDGRRPCTLDMHIVQTAFQAILDTPRDLSRRSDPVDLSPLEAAISAYRGDFLEGFSLADAPAFDDWVSQQREAWHQRLDRLFNRLSRLQSERGHVNQALETTRQWLEHNALNEAAYRRLMQLYLLAGDRTTALKAFAHCRRVLAEEVGAQPDAETLALAARIRAAAAPTATANAERPTPFLSELPFVGRAAEHSQLVAAYQAASQGTPQVVCVVGEAGIGKTRLMQTFLAWASIQQADILTGRTFEAGGQLPYQPLVAALRARIERDNAPADLLDDVWLAALSQLLPELRERYPDLPPPSTGDLNLARSHLYEAMAQLGYALARRHPVVLSIDDLQWADAATLDVLPYLCRRWAEGQTRLLLLVAVRHETLLATPHVREWLAHVEREISLTRLRLRPLTAEATRQLVHALVVPSADQQSASHRFSDWLFAETAGQPFFMAETVKMLVEHDVLQVARHQDGRWTIDAGSALHHIASHRPLPMPPSVREVIAARVGRLSGTAGALLVAAAVLGRPCRFEQLCRVAGVDELAGLSALDELVKSNLLAETPGVQRPYAFTHDKIRNVVYTDAGEARRRMLHGWALEGLQGEAAPATELAHHALAAGLLEPAFRHSVTAGAQAASVYAYSAAAQHYRHALDMATGNHDDNYTWAGATSEALTQLYLQMGRTLELTSDHVHALATYEEMERCAHERGDRAMELAALLARIAPLATVSAVFDPAQGERLAERALPLAQALGNQTAEADILWNQLIIYRNTNRLAHAVASGTRALTLARHLNLRERTAFVLHDLGYCFAFMADFEAARASFQEACAMWRACGNLPMLADSLTGACLAAILSGDYDGALALFDEALHVSHTTGSPWSLAGSRHNIGYVYADRGQVERALSEMEEGLRLSEQVGFISPLIVVRADLARLYGMMGAIDQGLDEARLAVRVAETKLPLFRVYPLAALAHLCLAQDDIATAGTLVEQMKADPNRDGLGIFATLILLTEAELALAQRTYDRARVLAEEALSAAQNTGARTFYPSAFDLQAQAWLGLGQWQVARERWLDARREAEALGARSRLWRIMVALSHGEVDPSESNRLRQQARDVVGYIAEHAPPDLRDSFLDMPEVRVLLADE